MADKDLDLGFIAPTEAGEDKDVLEALLDGASEDSQRELASDEDLRSLDLEFQDVAAWDEKVKKLEAILKDAKAKRDYYKDRMLEMMDLQGTSQFRSGEGMGSCYIQERFDTTLENEDAWLDWVKEKAPELLSVHSQTRTRFIRMNYRDKGVDPDSAEFPPGLNITPRKMLAVRGAKAKK